ncbi:hypothetical protein SAMN05216474_0360 [Lishizhenia tianjinensis]|uniref:DUF4199 domain-containing protein n=1 Tax=Lishizhenia tianjinensis TaxID=477690 RepID=A0A1I6XPE4_9FLAO|nr:hypothetical protein [Lishizhenia tianjinensis]SFT40218.1 hypothetical protein SAMN05216474_0360 [Lishizhenia tianjinensis]
MNWKLILSYASFGILVGLLSVFTNSIVTEPVFWLIYAFIAAHGFKTKVTSNRIAHVLFFGLICGILNAGVQALLVDSYLANNPVFAREFSAAPVSPKALIMFTGLLFGIIYGVIVFVLTMIFQTKKEVKTAD